MRNIFALSCCLFSMSFVASAAPEATKISYLALGDKGYWQVWILDTKSGDTRQLTTTEYDKNKLSLYPDKQRLLVNGGMGELVALNINDGTENSIELPVKGFIDAQLSPDGNHIAFSLSSTGNPTDNNIWLYNVADKALVKLTNLENIQHEPRWHPSGSKVYFHSKTDQDSLDLWAINLKENSQQQLTFQNLYHLDAAINDQDDIAFSGNQSGNYEIWILGADKTRTQITNHPAFDGNPQWLNHRTLVFESTRSGASNLWIVDTKTKALKQLTHLKTGARQPLVISKEM